MNLKELIQDKNFLSVNLRCMRKRLNWSQEELANQVGLNRGNIASYENGSAEPKICNLVKFSHLFKISIIDLTQEDLRNPKEQEKAASKFQSSVQGRDEFVERARQRLDEIEQLINSVCTCHAHQVKKNEEPPREMRHLVMHFEQLQAASRDLMKEYRDLVEYLRCGQC